MRLKLKMAFCLALTICGCSSMKEKVVSTLSNDSTTAFLQEKWKKIAVELKAENWSEAQVQIRDYIQASLPKRPLLASQAMVQLSLVYENLGEDALSLTPLLDAEKLFPQHSDSELKAEVLTRIQFYHAKMKNTAEADKYAQKADQQMKSLYSLQDNQKISEFYFKLGLINLTATDSATIRGQLPVIEKQQLFLFKALRLSKEPSKIITHIESNYNPITQAIIQKLEANDDLQTKEESVELARDYLGVLQKLKNLAAGYEEEKNIAILVNQLQMWQFQVEARVRDTSIWTPLTPESQKLNHIKQNWQSKDIPQ